MTEFANWIVESWMEELKNVLQFLTGEDWSARATPDPSAPSPSNFWWTQRFSLGKQAELSVGAPPLAWSEIGARILQAAGVDLIEQSSARSTYLEAIQQSTSSLARAFTARAGRSVEATAGRETGDDVEGVSFSVTLTSNEADVPALHVTVSDALSLAFAPSNASAAAAPAPPAAPKAAPETPEPALSSRAMSVLLDVQMPVSISFGKSAMPLREVLKLTTGSAVELDRKPDDEVDVVVNNCVIARGEVVVIDGNYGVRITNIISREQRLALRAGGKL